MTAFTVFIAPGGRADGVLAALTDLSAAGIVDRFGWIADPSPEVPADRLTVVDAGLATDVRLDQFVTTQRTTVLRVCSLVPAYDGDRRLSIPAEVAVVSALATATAAGAVVRIRCLLTGPQGCAADLDGTLVEGWHNIIVSPEDSRGPDFGRVPTAEDPSPAALGRTAAPAVVGVCGLWSGLEHAPLDDTAVLPGRVVRLARSYYRRLDTAAAEAALRRQVLAQDGELPLPGDQRTRVVYVDDVGMAAHSMANALWRKHGDVLRGPRIPYETETVDTLGGWAALTMFFGFLWAAIKNAPSAWYNKVVSNAAGRMAAQVQQAVFSEGNAAYEVVVRGRRADGGYADWREIGAASGHLSDTMTGHQPQQEAAADLSGVWQDYARAAMTLGDAGDRSGELPAIRVGAARGIVPRAQDAVPGSAERFGDIPGVIAAAVGFDGVDATDALGITDLRNRLGELQRDRDLGLAAGSTLTALAQWQRAHAHSFGAQVGDQLARAFHHCNQEVAQLWEKLRNAQAAPEAPPSDLRLARWVQVTVAALVVLAVVVGYLGYKEVIGVWTAVGIVVGAIVAALVCLAVAFVNIQRKLFALIHQRTSVTSAQRIDQQNLQAALSDLRRLSRAYGQFLSWSRAIGGFLAAPLGPDTHTDPAPVPIAWGLPMAAGLGAVVPDDTETATAAGYLRRDLFHPGWLTDSWDKLLAAGAPQQFGYEFAATSSPLWTDPGRGTGSGLDRWSSDLFGGALTSTGAELVWRESLGLLGGPMAGLAGRLVGAVAVAGGPTVPVADFLGGLERPAAPAGSFPTTLLTDTAIAGSGARVATDLRHSSRIGLGVVCAATQFSDALVSDQIRAGSGGAAAGTGWAATAAPAPDDGPPPLFKPSPGPSDEFRAPDLGKGFEF